MLKLNNRDDLSSHQYTGGMRVLKRGTRGYEDVKFDKITDRIRNLCAGLNVDPVKIALQTIRNIYDGITTEELDIISAKIAEGFKLLHPDYSILAAKILVSNLHKTTPRRFSDCMEIIAQNTELISQTHLEFICANANALDNMIIDSNDYLFDYLGFKTYEHGYLIKIPTDVLGADGKPIYVDYDGEVRTNVSTGKYPYGLVDGKKIILIKKTVDRVVDRPQYMFMRVAVALNMHRENALEHIKITYKAMSQLYYTHATPTLFNACMRVQQLNSCFLLGTDDSIEGIQRTKTNAALISKRAGGIGIHMHNIRSKGGRIRGTNGKSSGLPKQLKIYNEEACCWDQGGKRRGAFAIYLEPWHGDVLEFLRLKLNQGAETERARDLFYALWIPDLFIKRAEADLDWSLFSEHTAPGLSSVYDGMEVCRRCGHCENADFKKHANILEPLIRSKLNTTSIDNCDHLYMQCDVFTWLYTLYEDEGRAVKIIHARDLFDPICDSQRESGTPYVMLKDNVNRQSNQKNIGTIKSSNLCVTPETYILTDKGQQKIGDIVNTVVSVWNGDEFSSVTVRKTGQNQQIIRVNMSNGVSLDCTKYHKFYTIRDGKTVCVNAIDLKPDDQLIKYNLPTITDGYIFPHAYTHGLFCADGTYENTGFDKRSCDWKSVPGSSYCKRHSSHATGNEIPSEMCQGQSGTELPRITLYGEKRKLEQFIDKRIPSREENDRINTHPPVDIAAKFTVPLNACLQSKLEWFAGYCDGDGTVAVNGTNCSIQVASINKEFLLEIKLMLQTMGVDSKVTVGKLAGQHMLPDGHGGMKLFDCKELYRLLVTSNGVTKLQDMGFDPNRLNIPYQTPQRDATRFITITSVEDHGRVSDTFCFTEPLRHMGMFNGVLTGQCTEIMEWSSADSYACCTLASINLKKYLTLVDNSDNNDNSDAKYNKYTNYTNKYKFDFEKLHEIVRLITRNLDTVIDVNDYPVPECIENSHGYRPIGIGIQGLADVFAIMRIPYSSAEAQKLDLAIAETIYHAALTESNTLAVSRGKHVGFDDSPAARGILQFDMFLANQIRIGLDIKLTHMYDWEPLRDSIKEDGLRNSLVVALMPTVSTSQGMGNNESFEPFPANIYTKTTLAGKFTLTNNHMIRHLIELGLWTDVVKNKIIAADGSLQGVEEIPRNVRDIYKTVWEEKQSDLMKRAALRGAYVDQSQSLNIHLNDNSNGVLRGVIMTGAKLGLKTVSYYIRTRPASKAVKTNITEAAQHQTDASRTIRVAQELLSVKAEIATQKEMPNENAKKEESASSGVEDESTPVDVDQINMDDISEQVCPIGCTSCSS